MCFPPKCFLFENQILFISLKHKQPLWNLFCLNLHEKAANLCMMENAYILSFSVVLYTSSTYFLSGWIVSLIGRKTFLSFIIFQIYNKLTFCSPEWNNTTEGYSTSNEDKTATRLSEGTTRVLYSSDNSYRCGFPITFRVLDAGEKTPFDGIGLSANDEDIETLQRSNSIFVATSGNHL